MKRKLALSMFIFGTIGIFIRHIPLSSSMIALGRGFIGVLFLLLFTYANKSKISIADIKRNLGYLCLSGISIGVNWILLFESYRYTSVATATLCYYLAPIFVILASPFVLKEKLTVKKISCIAVALLGMVFVSGILETGVSGFSEMYGILLGIGAAVFYASVILFNKQMKGISSYDMTILQLGIATALILPYTLLTEGISDMEFTFVTLLLLVVIGILHTGVAYVLYFSSIQKLKAQTAAIFSYIDPVVAIILSAAILNEEMRISNMAGAVMILSSTLISELPEKRSIN